jgi:hypothetical protein
MFASLGFVKDNPATLEKMSLLLRAGGIVYLKGSGNESNTLLYPTVERQDLKAAEMLLSHNASPNQLINSGHPLVAYAARSSFPSLKTLNPQERVLRDTTSDLILVALLRRGVEDKHVRYALDLRSQKIILPPAQRAVLQKVLNAKPLGARLPPPS